MRKQKVLFVCIHNSARSQMAEAWLNHLCGDTIEAESAGLEPGVINPLVIEVMQEEGIDLSFNTTQSVFDVVKSGRLFSHVIAVCDGASAQRCPVFVGVTKRLDWPFPDPGQVTGTQEEKLAQVRVIRDEIRARVEAWCPEMCPVAA